MTEKEKELFFHLCRFLKTDQNRLEEILEEGATPHVLGQLFFNRTQGIAYGVLKQSALLGKVNREFRNSLESAHQINVEKNKSFTLCLKYLSDILSDHRKNYAMLKGALLCGTYPLGYRTSNDIDLLVLPRDITDIGESLIKAGFRQGYVQNNRFIPATRKKIIESRMMRGETVPYILEVNLPEMQFLEVDINFSLDYKNDNGEILSTLIHRTRETKVNDINIITLGEEDFFIHLCNHLYKEATTFPWVKMKRDMTLYKYCDIYFLLDQLPKEATEALIKQISETGMTEICSCAIIWTHQLLGIKNQMALDFAYREIEHHTELLHSVSSPANNKLLHYDTKDIKQRFFHPNRTKILQEVEK